MIFSRRWRVRRVAAAEGKWAGLLRACKTGFTCKLSLRFQSRGLHNTSPVTLSLEAKKAAGGAPI